MVAGFFNGLFTVEAEDGVLTIINCFPVVRAVFPFCIVLHCNNTGIKGKVAFFTNSRIFTAMNVQSGAHNHVAVRADVAVSAVTKIAEFQIFVVLGADEADLAANRTDSVADAAGCAFMLRRNETALFTAF